MFYPEQKKPQKHKRLRKIFATYHIKNSLRSYKQRNGQGIEADITHTNANGPSTPEKMSSLQEEECVLTLS